MQDSMQALGIHSLGGVTLVEKAAATAADAEVAIAMPADPPQLLHAQSPDATTFASTFTTGAAPESAPSSPAAATRVGLKWCAVGTKRPQKGDLIINQALGTALRKKQDLELMKPESERKDLVFTEAEIDAFQLQGLEVDHFIKAGDEYFEQVALPTQGKVDGKGYGVCILSFPGEEKREWTSMVGGQEWYEFGVVYDTTTPENQRLAALIRKQSWTAEEWEEIVALLAEAPWFIKWSANVQAAKGYGLKLIAIAKASGGFGNYQRAELTYLRKQDIDFSIASVELIREVNADIRKAAGAVNRLDDKNDDVFRALDRLIALPSAKGSGATDDAGIGHASSFHISKPSTQLSPPPPLRLADNQMLIVWPDGVQAFDEHTAVLAIVTADGVKHALGGGAPLQQSLECCSHAVVPWRPALLLSAQIPSEVPAALRKRIQALHRRADGGCFGAMGCYRSDGLSQPSRRWRGAIDKAADALFRKAANLLQLPSLARAPSQAIVTANTMAAVQAAVEQLGPELAAAAAKDFRHGGAVGARSYAVGQQLTVCVDGVWRDAEVKGEVKATGTHLLSFIGVDREVDLMLHPWNHAALEVRQEDFSSLLVMYTAGLKRRHAARRRGARISMIDIDINLKGEAREVASVTNARSLTKWLRDEHIKLLRSELNNVERPDALLLIAGPASGKTTLLSEIESLLLDGELVPIPLKVQRLQRFLSQAEHTEKFATSWNWVDAYLRIEHTESPHVYRMLRQAMMARRALLLLDGLDEGGTKRTDIERHVAEVLAPQGHLLLCTSRPAGVDAQRFADFWRLDLKPITEQQQEIAMTAQFGAKGAAKLLRYVDRMPRSTENGLRLTSNPLMLAMIISVFERRQSEELPATIAELYEVETNMMLTKGGATQPALRQVLQRLFFEAQVAQRREIEERHLDEAALAMDSPGHASRSNAQSLAQLSPETREALRMIRARVADDDLPLLSLLKAEPLLLQASHLSFQEYFAARALCEEGTKLGGTPPWQWTAWWANTVTIGASFGSTFWRGMLRAAGINGSTLHLSNKLGGDRATVLRVVIGFMALLNECSMRGNNLGIEGWTTIFTALGDSHNSTITTWDLSGERLGSEIAKPLAEYMSTTSSLTHLDLSCNPLKDDGISAICQGILSNKKCKLTSLDISQTGCGPAGAKSVTAMAAACGSMSAANLLHNELDVQSAKILVNTLKDMSLCGVKLDQTGAQAGRDGGLAQAPDFKPADAVLLASDLAKAGIIGGFPTSDLSSNLLLGRLVDKLKRASFSKETLRASGFSMQDLSAIHFSVQELKVGGFSAQELKAVGFSAQELKAVGFSAQELKAVSFSAQELTSLYSVERDRFFKKVGQLHFGSDGKSVDWSRKGLRDADCSDVVIILASDASGALAQLQLLNLAVNHIGDPGITALAQACASGALAQLKELKLYNNMVGDPGLTALASACASGALAKLEKLILYQNQIGDAGVTALASACASGALAQLKELNLAFNQIGDPGMSALASACASGALAQLRELVLDGNRIGDAGVSALASACASGALAQLKELNLNFNKVGDPGLTALASACASGALAKLNNVYLADNPGNGELVKKVLRERKK